MKEYILNQMLISPDLKKMINLGAEYIGNPICLQNLAHQAIAHSDDYPVDDMNDRLRRKEKADPKDFENDLIWIRQAIQSGQPCQKAWPYMRRGRIYCGCLYKRRAIAFLRVPEMERPLSELDGERIAFVAKIMATALVLNGYPTAEYDHPWYSFLWNAFETPKEEMKYSVIQPFMEEFNCYRVLWVYESAAGALKKRSVLAKQWWELPIREGTVVLVDGNDQKMMNELQAIAVREKCIVGASDSFADIRQVRQAFEKAKAVVEYAALYGQECGVACFDRYKLYHLAKKTIDQVEQDVRSECKSNIMTRIREYDREKGTEYMVTLITYLKENKNVNATAKRLNIHRNTVFYRITKLKELFELDLEDLLAVTSLYYQIVMSDTESLRSL